MAGLLDFMNTDDGMQGLGLLAAAGPSMEPQNLASRLALAGKTYRGLQDDALKSQLTKAQLGEFATKNQLEQFQLQRLKDWQAMVSGGATPQAATAQPSPQIGTANSIGGVVPQFSGPLTTTTPNAPAPAASSSGFPFALRGMSDAQTRAIAGSMSPEKYMELYATQSAPQTDIEKLMAAQGISKDSPLGRQILQTATAKANYTAPVNARPGSILRDPYDPSKVVAYNPHIPDGTRPVFGPNGEVSEFQPIGNAEAALGLGERAKTFGKAQATPSVVYDAAGNPTFSTVATDVQRAGGGTPQFTRSPFIKPGDADRPMILGKEMEKAQADLAAAKTPEEVSRATQNIQGLTREMKAGGIPVQPGGLTPQQRPGVVQGATLSQDELSKKGATLMSDNGQTNTVISRLQNIKMLAPGAITGAETGRRDFFNGLLSLAGIKGAEDSKTASDLVEKNSAQIVSALRMGTGGGGSDALQTLLGSANPNRHMTKEAITEAADQLIASQKMIQDKAKVLQPHYTGRDPVNYANKELAFDQNADPRIWQLHSMNPQQQAAYIRTLPADVAADLLKKRQALKQIGVF